MAYLQRIEALIYAAVKAIGALAALLMIVVTFLDVLGRHFWSPIPGASEIISVLLGTTFFAGMSIVVREQGQIVVGLLVDRYSTKARAIEQFVSGLVSALAMGLITWIVLAKGRSLAAAQTLSGFLDFELAKMAWLLTGLAAIATLIAFSGLLPRQHRPPEGDGEGSPERDS